MAGLRRERGQERREIVVVAAAALSAPAQFAGLASRLNIASQPR